jgi:tripartite-type tricarboxylate transporter receptor subunit TctC
MKLLRRQFLHLAAGAAAALPALSDIAAAQAWPARPVRLIVPFPPGGTTDIFARIAAQKLSEHFGKQFYIENVAGATGNVGAAQVARATPDGYTVLFTFSSYVVNPTLFAKLPFDPNKDLMPVTLAVAATNVLTINPSVPARNLGDLIALLFALGRSSSKSLPRNDFQL